MEIIEKVIKIFFDWTKLKISIHSSEIKKFPKKREIWWASLGQNIGVEINGKNKNFERPILVIKKYNNDSILVLPISSKVKESKFYFKFVNNDKEENIVNLSQLRTISSKRLVRKVWKLEGNVYAQIKEKLKEFI